MTTKPSAASSTTIWFGTRSPTVRWVERCVTTFAVAAIVGVVIALLGVAQGYRPVVLQTGSMGDTMPPGSLVVASPKSATAIDVGDVLVMRNDGRMPVTHRVIEVENTDVGLVARTQGDANAFADPAPYALGDDELVARWVMTGAGTWLERVTEPATWVAMLALAIAVVAAVALRRVWVGVPTATTPIAPTSTAAHTPPRRLTSAHVAVVLTVTATVVGVGLVISLVRAPAKVGADVVGESDCSAAEVSTVQSGRTVLTATGTVTESIEVVDPTRAFVTASVRSDSTEVADASALVTLTGPTTLDVIRATDAVSAPSVTVAWSVVEYVCGITVQRGIGTGTGTNSLDVTIDAVDPAASFVVLDTLAPATATTFGPDDLVRPLLTTSTNLSIEASTTAVLSPTRSFAWQVVTFEDADDGVVQTVSGSLDAADSATVLRLPTPIDRRSTFITAWVTSEAAGPAIGQRMIRAALIDGGTIQVDRSATGPVIDVFVQVVTLPSGATVQHGTLDVSAGGSTTSSQIAPVDMIRSSVLSTVAAPGPAAGGRSDHVADSTIGEGSATFELTATDEVRITRDATTSDASFGWQVVEWPGSRR